MKASSEFNISKNMPPITYIGYWPSCVFVVIATQPHEAEIKEHQVIQTGKSFIFVQPSVGLRSAGKISCLPQPIYVPDKWTCIDAVKYVTPTFGWYRIGTEQ